MQPPVEVLDVRVIREFSGRAELQLHIVDPGPSVIMSHLRQKYGAANLMVAYFSSAETGAYRDSAFLAGMLNANHVNT
jgi:hypothetical protein